MVDHPGHADASPSARAPAQRLWRVRKDSRTVDALLRLDPDPDPDGSVSLQYFFNGHLVYGRRCPSRAEALSEADAKLRELQVRGWSTHW
jgi:hypothetical protein